MMTKLAVAALFFLVATATQAEEAWSHSAIVDLTAVHDLIRDNHPGPVDPRNPDFNAWLERGFQKALPLAKSANTHADYTRALMYYVNGFKDGHLRVFLKEDSAKIWPGFLTATAANGTTKVAVAGKNSPVDIGASLVSCDGASADALLESKVNRFYSNADIPHEAIRNAPLLFTAAADDTRLIRSCRFNVDGRARVVKLKWRPIGKDELNAHLDVARQSVSNEMGLREVNGVWFVSLPTFDLWGKKAKAFQSLIQGLKAGACDLHKAPYVVIDVRGNGGGNSSWGVHAAAALWGEEMVNAIINSFDNTTVWRTSELNAKLTRQAADRSAKAGLNEDAGYRRQIADALDAARARGESLYHLPSPPRGPGLPADAASPFSGKVYFLTDMACASACLDFADIMTRLPGVTHIGLPTSADAVYIDNVSQMLPSGAAWFTWSVKVYYHRVRDNNEWYKPQIKWSGGAMTDEVVSRWVKSLDLSATDQR
jgi:hypothetical protein